MGLAILDFVHSPLNNELSSTKYMKAGGEVLVSILGICWIVTYFTQPQVIAMNPLKERLGYNNVCVGLDSKPAAYVAAFLWPIVSYFNIRAAWIMAVTEMNLEAKHTSTSAKCVTIFASFINLVSTCVLAILFLFPPEPDVRAVWIHTSIYVFFIIGRLFGIAVQYYRNYLDDDPDQTDLKNTKTSEWIFLYVYTGVSLALPVLFLVNYSWYDLYRKPDVDGDEPLIPWYITFTLDYTWLACVGCTTKFLPAQTSLIMREESLRKSLKPENNA